ncbi:hypothetical protein FFLO_05853 [Filobasidium floriforme]|uniref:Rhomboid-type serine protease n=1 Tax=Filobasidium floriforme TaxID=5210 RepID=A0A8K0JG43_9TREE|nr:hypothetical protein FFLO_05853 [Filobasidium floriforme]
MPLSGPRPLPDPAGQQIRQSTYTTEEREGPLSSDQPEFIPLTTTISTPTIRTVSTVPTSNPDVTSSKHTSTSRTSLPFPENEPTTGYLDPYIYTPAPAPSSYNGYALGPKRNQSVGSRSLAPSDSASNFDFGTEDRDGDELGAGAGGAGQAGLGRQKSTLRPLDEEGEDVTQSGTRGYGQGQGHGHGYRYGYRDGQDDQGRSPYTTNKAATGYGYPPGPYPFGAQARSQALPPLPHHQDHSYSGLEAGRPVSAAGLSGLSYVDEEGGYYRSGSGSGSKNNVGGFGGRQGEKHGGEEEGESLVGGAAYPAGSPFLENHAHKHKHDPTSSSYPPSINSRLDDSVPGSPKWYEKLLGIGQGKYPIEQQIENKRRGLGRQRWPYACWVLTLAMCGVMIWEMISQNHAQGTPIAIKPNFNYMIGPSSGVLISDGARFVPCIKRVPDLPPSFPLACLNDTNNPPQSSCSLGSICGFGGIKDDETPNQWFRFILPIFLHVGIVHLLLNMLAQLTIGAQVEREMGTIAFVITYFAGGIYGFILGGSFSRTGIPSAGASGALFACSAVMVVDLALHWSYEDRPGLKAFFLFLEFGVGIAIGQSPFAVDGMAHLGGYAMGLLCGMILMPAILPTKRKAIIVWVLRAIALVLVTLGFVLTIKNFYTDDPNAACQWCKYLSCIPTKSNDHCSGTVRCLPDIDS